jgi:hypothetical protein
VGDILRGVTGVNNEYKSLKIIQDILPPEEYAALVGHVRAGTLVPVNMLYPILEAADVVDPVEKNKRAVLLDGFPRSLMQFLEVKEKVR